MLLMLFHAVVWCTMLLHVIPFSCMIIHDAACSMLFYVVACYYMLFKVYVVTRMMYVVEYCWMMYPAVATPICHAGLCCWIMLQVLFYAVVCCFKFVSSVGRTSACICTYSNHVIGSSSPDWVCHSHGRRFHIDFILLCCCILLHAV